MKLKRTAMLAALLASVAAGSAVADGPGRGYYHHHHRGYWGLAVGVPLGMALYASAQPPVYYPPAYYAPRTVVVQSETPVYIEKPVARQAYWYYCNYPQGYYPYVQQCPGGWQRVLPSPPPY